MTTKTEVSNRIRVNIKQLAKGNLTFECTVELTDAGIGEVLEWSDQLVAELLLRYPAEGG